MSDQIDDEPDPSRPLSVDYDNREPSPYFTAEQIAYIESIGHFLDEEEVEKVRKSERFVYNSIFGFYGVEVHGLRLDHRQGCVYVPRFGTLPYIEMMEKFAYKAYEYLDEDIRGRCSLPSYRLMCSDGKSFFPFHLS